MDYQITLDITSAEIAAALGLTLQGSVLPVRVIKPVSAACAGALCFAKPGRQFSIETPATVIAGPVANTGAGCVIESSNPRLDFARALAWIDSQAGFSRPTDPPQVHPTARIGAGSVLANGVQIGAHTVVHHNAVIGEGVIIGERCVIKSCAVIGEDGFGFERDEHGMPVRLVHLGTVRIGNDVEIGSLTTVCRGTLSDTVIEDHAKIDDHVHIAHNVQLRRGAMVVACAEVSGGVEVGEQSWIGPNATVIQQVMIGRRALVGIGANVIRNVGEGVTVAGNPAKPLTPKA